MNTEVMTVGNNGRAPTPRANRWRTGGLGLCVAVALVLAGCGSSDGDKEDPSGSAADKATGEPIVLGWTNTDSGPNGQPEATQAAEAAVAYINEHGGVKGRPLKLNKCSTDGTPAASTKCANQFVGDNVLSVLQTLEIGIDSALPIYKSGGYRLFGAFAGGIGTAATPDNTILSPPYELWSQSLGEVFSSIGVKKAVIAFVDLGPIVKQVFGVMKKGAAKSGVELSLTTVDPANPDVTAAVQAAKSAGAKAIYFQLPENDCTNAIKTAKQLGWDGEIWAGSCAQFVDQLGPQAEGVISYEWTAAYPARAAIEKWNPGLKEDFTIFESAIKDAGHEDIFNKPSTPLGFSTVMTWAQLVEGIDGELTKESVNKAMESFKGREFLGDEVDCTDKLLPGGSCGRSYFLYKSNADGTQALVNDAPFNLADGQ